MLKANGWYNAIQEIEDLDRYIRDLAMKRNARLQELLADVRDNHQTGACKVAFRPCHARRLGELTVTTEFWLV